MRKRNIVTLVALLFLCIPIAKATDIGINPIGANVPLSNLQWGTSAGNGFNNNFFFSPLTQPESVCVFIYNNNPTNPHTFTASIVTNANPQNISPSDATWQTAAATVGLNAATSPGLPAGIGATISGVALVSVNLSASSVQAGSPDTATVRIVQTQGTCSSSQNFNNGAPVQSSSLSSFQAASEGFASAFSFTSTITNPAGPATIILGITDNSSTTKSAYFDSVTVSCSAACSLVINEINSNGTCTGSSNPVPAKMNGSFASIVFTTVSCTVNPSQIGAATVLQLAANTPFTFDLKGYQSGINNNNGIDITSAALTGNVSATLKWYEK